MPVVEIIVAFIILGIEPRTSELTLKLLELLMLGTALVGSKQLFSLFPKIL